MTKAAVRSSAFPAAAPELGLGTLSIGRVWGIAEAPPPPPEAVPSLFERAVELGIRVFDTAPAYARSEALLGRFLTGLPTQARRQLVVMTKAGEIWSDAGSSVDHGYDALAASLDTSLRLLGHIDVWQIHKASEAAIRARSVAAAVERARRSDVRFIGASVSDPTAAAIAVASGMFDCLQFPYSLADTRMEATFAACRDAGMFAVVNRPLGMGALAGAGAAAAFAHVRNVMGRGVVLTGTGKSAHLDENAAAFRAAASS